MAGANQEACEDRQRHADEMEPAMAGIIRQHAGPMLKTRPNTEQRGELHADLEGGGERPGREAPRRRRLSQPGEESVI